MTRRMGMIFSGLLVLSLILDFVWWWYYYTVDILSDTALVEHLLCGLQQPVRTQNIRDHLGDLFVVLQSESVFTQIAILVLNSINLRFLPVFEQNEVRGKWALGNDGVIANRVLN